MLHAVCLTDNDQKQQDGAINDRNTSLRKPVIKCVNTLTLVGPDEIVGREREGDALTVRGE